LKLVTYVLLYISSGLVVGSPRFLFLVHSSCYYEWSELRNDISMPHHSLADAAVSTRMAEKQWAWKYFWGSPFASL